MANERPTIYYNQSKPADQVKSKWWAQPDEVIHEHLWPLVHKIRMEQTTWRERLFKFERLYETGEITASTWGRSHGHTVDLSNRLSYNVGKSCVDTAASKIAKNKPRAFYLSDKLNWEYGRRAKNMTKFMEGMFGTIGTGEEKDIYGVGRKSFVDGGVQGTGALKIFKTKDHKIKVERTFVSEILVDEVEGRYGQPRQMHHTRLAFREVLMDLFPEHKAKIERVNRADTKMRDESSQSYGTDFVEVVESYHLPSGPGSDDGKKVICIENCTLHVEPWKKEYFPYVFFRWTSPLRGFYGIGLIEELYGIQYEINKLLKTVQMAQHLMATPQVWLEIQARTVASQISNEIGGIRYYKGRPPIFMTPQAMSGEVYQHIESLYRKAYEITGISLLSATSQKPAGLDSGVALREYNDIQTERFSLVEQRWEDMYMSAANIIEDLCNDMADAGHDPTVEVKDGKHIQRLSWKQIRLPKDRRIVRPHPANILPTTPAGKLQKVQELTQTGFFTKEEALDLLDYPDLAPVISLKTAARNDIRDMIERIIDTGVYENPEPFQDPMQGRAYAQSYYLQARAAGAPESVQENLIQLMLDFDAEADKLAKKQAEMQAQAQAAAVAQQAPPPDAAPVAQPEAAPTSDLMPVTA